MKEAVNKKRGNFRDCLTHAGREIERERIRGSTGDV